MKWAVVLLLVGCGAAPQPATPQAFCDGVAQRDPAVKAAILRGLTDGAYAAQSAPEIARIKARARADCLRRQGILPAGEGVQAPE